MTISYFANGSGLVVGTIVLFETHDGRYWVERSGHAEFCGVQIVSRKVQFVVVHQFVGAAPAKFLWTLFRRCRRPEL